MQEIKNVKLIETNEYDIPIVCKDPCLKEEIIKTALQSFEEMDLHERERCLVNQEYMVVDDEL